jgi:hypothetical protein
LRLGGVGGGVRPAVVKSRLQPRHGVTHG